MVGPHPPLNLWRSEDLVVVVVLVIVMKDLRHPCCIVCEDGIVDKDGIHGTVGPCALPENQEG